MGFGLQVTSAFLGSSEFVEATLKCPIDPSLSNSHPSEIYINKFILFDLRTLLCYVFTKFHLEACVLWPTISIP